MTVEIEMKTLEGSKKTVDRLREKSLKNGITEGEVKTLQKHMTNIDKLSRSENKDVRVEAQKTLNKIDGIVDDKGKTTSEPLAKEKRVEVNKVALSGWIDCTPEEAKEYEKQKILVGYDPNTNKAKLK